MHGYRLRHSSSHPDRISEHCGKFAIIGAGSLYLLYTHFYRIVYLPTSTKFTTMSRRRYATYSSAINVDAMFVIARKFDMYTYNGNGVSEPMRMLENLRPYQGRFVVPFIIYYANFAEEKKKLDIMHSLSYFPRRILQIP